MCKYNVGLKTVVYIWGFYDIKFKLTQYKSKLGLIPQYTFDLRDFKITNLKFGSNTTIYLAQHVTLTHYKPKPGLIPQYTKQTTLQTSHKPRAGLSLRLGKGVIKN